MLVHVCVTDPALETDRERVAAALQDDGIDVTLDDAMVLEGRAHVDALVCLLGRTGHLVEDGTQLAERTVRVALDRDLPALAYDVSTDDVDARTDHREGYARARLERLRSRLRETETFTRVEDRAVLPELVRRALIRLRGVPQQIVHDAIRSLHERIREHPSPTYDAFTVSMHNVDHVFSVPRVPVNREVRGEYRGAEPGGAGANTIVALRRLGLHVAVAGAVGDDADGVMLRRALNDEDIVTTMLLTVDGAATGRAVMLRAADGGYSSVVDSGANRHLGDEIDRRGVWRLLVDSASRSRVLHLSPFATATGRRPSQALLYEVPDETVVSYKPGAMDAELGVDGLAATLARCDVLFVAEAELDLLLLHVPGFNEDASISSKIDLLFAWRRQLAHDRALVIAVIAGLEDPSVVDPVRLHWGTTQRAGTIGPEVGPAGGRWTVTDLAGARDAVVAGVLFGLMRSRPPIDCANLAHVLAVSAFEEYGCRTALLRSTQVRDRWRSLVGVEPPRWLDPYG